MDKSGGHVNKKIDSGERGLAPEARERLKAAVASEGGPSAVARRLGWTRQQLHALLNGAGDVRVTTLATLCEELGLTVDYVMTGREAVSVGVDEGVVRIPIVEIEASAGPGLRTAVRPQVVDHLPMPEWLARQLGDVSSLQVVTARGDSGSPEINDGDLVMLDTSKLYRGEALYVIVLDGDLAIKRLQRQAGGMRVLSRNPDYPPMEIPAGEVDDRLRVLGRVVWSGRTY